MDLDRQLSAIYKKAKKLTPSPPLLKSEQIRWIVDADACIYTTKNNDIQCLIDYYQKRILYLSRMIKSQHKIDNDKDLLATQKTKLKRLNKLKTLNNSAAWNHFIDSNVMTYYQKQPHCMIDKNNNFKTCVTHLYKDRHNGIISQNTINDTLKNYTELHTKIRGLSSYVSDAISVAKYSERVGKSYQDLILSLLKAIENSYPGCDKKLEARLTKQLDLIYNSGIRFYSDLNYYLYRDRNPNIWGAVDVSIANIASYEAMAKQLISIFNLVQSDDCGPEL
ncbi:lysozyme inhibitor LprI family protein [Dongshaea marina]|uniref:hypothetical protein n=1 Tax=Dongshaea marina TaxID=2047966 RepID=UPI000D3E5FD4|nr:hypothetical protein [Dongshaea marina]